MIQNINTLSITGITFERLLKFFPYSLQQKPYQLKFAKRGTRIYEPFQQTDSVYLVKKGRIKIGVEQSTKLEKDNTVLSTKTYIHHIAWEGELFGEIALMGTPSMPTFAETMEDMEYYEISASAMQSLMQQNWMVQMQVLQLVGKRFREAQKRLEGYSHQDTRTRIITFLLDLAMEKGEKVGKYGFWVRSFFQQADIAALLGCSLPAVGLVLRELKQKKLISYGRKRLQIYNRHELKFAIRE
ncbi:MAG: Crp/Fnr family transcriptional regulator [Chitinophagales bacterium]